MSRSASLAAQTAEPTAPAPASGELAAPTVEPDAAPPPAATAGASADAQLEAQARFRRGVSLVEQQRLPEAVDAFRASAALVPRPSTFYNLALSLFRLGRYRECLDAVTELESQLGQLQSGDEGMRERAATLRTGASEQLARLVLLVEPADARLNIDGEPVWLEGATRALLLDPGMHRVRLEREGFTATTRELRLPAGRAVRETIELRREPSAAAAPREPSPDSSAVRAAAPVDRPERPRASSRLAPALLLGGAGVLVVSGAVTGVVTADKDDSVRSRCGGDFDNCPPSVMGEADEVERLALVTDLLLFGGAALGIAGGILWFVLDEPDGALQAGLAPGAVTFCARF